MTNAAILLPLLFVSLFVIAAVLEAQTQPRLSPRLAPAKTPRPRSPAIDPGVVAALNARDAERLYPAPPMATWDSGAERL